MVFIQKNELRRIVKYQLGLFVKIMLMRKLILSALAIMVLFVPFASKAAEKPRICAMRVISQEFVAPEGWLYFSPFPGVHITGVPYCLEDTFENRLFVFNVALQGDHAEILMSDLTTLLEF